MVKVLLPLPGISLFYTPDLTQRNDVLARVSAVLGQTDKQLFQPITFPHTKASLSHSKKALVVAVLHTENDAIAIGVDVETFRPLRLPQTLRFYANRAEQDWWANHPNQSSAAIQLWTMKEAAYKAYHTKDRSLIKPRVSHWVSVICPVNPGQLATQWQVSHPDYAYKGIGLTFTVWPETWVSVCILVRVFNESIKTC